MRYRAVLVTLGVLICASVAHSQSLDDQERCALQAKRAFEEHMSQYEKPPHLPKPLVSDYQSHFNTRLKKCLVLVDTWGRFETAVLMDAYERRVYATYGWTSNEGKKYWEVPPIICDLIATMRDKKRCQSREEFYEFVAPYMEE